MRWRTALSRNGQPWLGLIGAVVLVAVGLALWFALAGPTGRAGAVAGALAAAASTVAALAAIYLSKEALARTDRQLASSFRATVLSRYPLLLPIHQSVSFPDSGGNIAAHPPSEERFRLSSAQSASYAFVADTKDGFIIPIENVGEGPALGIVGRLWRSDGCVAELVGPSALGAGRVAVMTALLHRPDRDCLRRSEPLSQRPESSEPGPSTGSSCHMPTCSATRWALLRYSTLAAWGPGVTSTGRGSSRSRTSVKLTWPGDGQAAGSQGDPRQLSTGGCQPGIVFCRGAVDVLG